MSVQTAASIAALWASGAIAYEITQPLPPCENRAPLAAPVAARPIGLPPILDGQCKWVLPEVNTVGAAAAWWCERPDKPPLLIPYAVEWASVTPEMRDDFVALMWPGDRAARMQAMQAKYGTKHFLDMCNVWGPMRERINAARPPDPVPSAWRVAPFGTQRTRPAYKLAGVTLGAASGRADVGAACACPSTPLVINRATHCPVAAGPVDVVTACERVTP